MAERRCFTKKITESDAFLEMPLSTQCLYFHLNMSADDDGFVNSPKKIARMIGASDDDLKLLIAKAFILVFESGVIVIKHWRMNNTLRNDRYHPTDYQEEFHMLGLKDNKSYTWQPNGNQLEPEHNITKHNINNKEKEIYKEREREIGLPKKKYGEFENVLLSEEEYCKLEKSNLLPYIEKLSSYIASKGKRYKNHYATILNWYRKDHQNQKPIPEWFNKEIESSEDENELEDFKEFLEELNKEGEYKK